MKPKNHEVAIKIFKTYSYESGYEPNLYGIGIVRALGLHCYWGERFELKLNDTVICDLEQGTQFIEKYEFNGKTIEDKLWMINDCYIMYVISPEILWRIHEFKDNCRYESPPLTSMVPCQSGDIHE